jgi:dolichol-phosphate mannosyltransferase
MRATIILPTYNEKKNLERIVRAILKQGDFHLIIVDDNSPDGTGRLADELASSMPMTVIHRKGKLGLSSAVAAGFRVARTEIIGVMDADLSHPPEVLPKLMKSLDDADIAIASRNMEGGRVEIWPWSRRMISRAATLLARVLTNVTDPMSGFFFVRRQVIDKLEFSSKGYKILLEILVKGNYGTVVEVPYVFRNRDVGESKLNRAQYMQYLIDVSRLYAYKVFR